MDIQLIALARILAEFHINADGKPHLPYIVEWFVGKRTTKNEVVCTCDCSLQASAGYPCRNIIPTALYKKAKIT